jgi:hypothetical protein
VHRQPYPTRTSVPLSGEDVVGYRAGVIRDVVMHMHSEQPLMCDLKELPTVLDQCLVCTNLRYVDGRKPPFIDRTESLFLIPLGLVRLVEVRQRSIEAALPAEQGHLNGTEPHSFTSRDADDDLNSDEELLRRIREV